MDDKKRSRLIPLTQWSKYHNFPSVGGLRHLVFQMPDGFEKVIKRVCTRVLIDEDAWFEFVESESKKSLDKINEKKTNDKD